MRLYHQIKLLFVLALTLVGSMVCESISAAEINQNNDFSEFDRIDPDIPEALEPLVTAKPIETPSVEKVEETSDQHHEQMNNFSPDEFELIRDSENDLPGNQDDTSSKENFDARSATTMKPLDLKFANVPVFYSRSWKSCYIELVIMICLMVYMGNFLIGKTKNASLANTWFMSNRDLLEENFSIVGDDGYTQPPTNMLSKDYEHVYSLWCSGRVSVEGMQIEIRLLNRQCLLNSFIQILKPGYDLLTFKVNLEDSEMDGWIMALGRKRKLVQLLKDYSDLATFITDKRGVKHPSLPDSFLVLSEITEATSSVLSPSVCKVLTQYEDQIEYLHFSDQYVGPKIPLDDASTNRVLVGKKVLNFAFRLGNKGKLEESDMDSVKHLLQFVFFLIEKIPKIRLNKISKAKSDAARKAAQEVKLKSQHVQRQEAAQLRKDEKRRAVKERIMAEEDPDKARRLEEREQRKDKKKQSKVKMIKVKGM